MVPTISLDAREKLLKDCLAECARALHPPLQIRFAGGWVRDKLLGQQSNDIDAALSSLSGKDFGQLFLQFYEKDGDKYKEEAARLGIENRELNKIVLVEEDAEKSKHLAVAKMKLFGLEVDLVNLRTEVYASDSRTPVMQMGTAEEDALRRDATINALFYNIHTDQVEDFTGKGLDDMKNRIMRTPLEPHQTFQDDPLRVLRLIRFASRLDFEIDAAAQTAMRSPLIHEALKMKISRERVRAEIIKALDGPRPAKALLYIQNLDLFSSCFANPTDLSPPSPRNLPQTYEFLGKILADDFLPTALHLHNEPPSIPWLLAAYTPWADLPPEKGCTAIKSALKATVRESRLLTAALTHRPEISALIQQTTQSIHNPDPIPRSKIAMSLRRWGPTWPLQTLYSLLHDSFSFSSQSNALPLSRYRTFLTHLQHLKLDGTQAHDQRPLLDGRQIKEILGREKGGPANRFAADLVLEWGFDHAEGSGGGLDEEKEEQCAQMLRGRVEEILRWEARQAGRKRGIEEM